MLNNPRDNFRRGEYIDHSCGGEYFKFETQEAIRWNREAKRLLQEEKNEKGGLYEETPECDRDSDNTDDQQPQPRL